MGQKRKVNLAPEKTYTEWHQALSSREQRLEQVLDMMSKGQWLSGVTDKLLAEQWKCTPQNVRQISAEANRVIRARLRDDKQGREEARAAIMQNIEVIRAKAMRNADSASLRVALDALRAYGFYLGIEPAKKLEVGTRQDAFMEGWTTEEKVAYSTGGELARRKLSRRLRQAQVVAPPPDGANGHDPDDSGEMH